MPTDRFASFATGPTLPATDARAITPSDTVDLPSVTLSLNAATFGQVRVTTREGTVSDVTIAPGVCFPLRVSRVWATGTTASGLCGLF